MYSQGLLFTQKQMFEDFQKLEPQQDSQQEIKSPK